MTTDEIMALAVKMAGFPGVPEDSAIFVGGRNIRKVLFGVDVGPAELMVAKELGMDLVIAHHPTGVYLDQWKVLLRHVEFMTAAGVPEDAALGAVAERVEADVEIAYEQVARRRPDSLDAFVDYEELGRLVRAQIEMSRCKLIETLAEEVALALLEEFQTPRVRVRLRKLHIPVAGFSGVPEVEIERARA